MSRKQLFLTVLLASVLGGLLVLAGFSLVSDNKQPTVQTAENDANVKFSRLLEDSSFTVPKGLNFVYAAKQATPAVVHIKAYYESNGQSMGRNNPFEDMLRDFFGENYPQQHPRSPQGSPRARSAGSGVIISKEGFIATNNHVVEDADKIEVTLDNNRQFEARIVGTDPNTDLALIKIDAEKLPSLKFGNSDDLQVGEWVLAVGNPFNLTSTVTAGIVSAKGRSINILREKDYGIEAFIQTDAAVNPGNSGGALVNLKGELIGINTAIATPTGTYAGYSFAVPSSLVKKVMGDLKEYGVVQRALLGIRIRNVNAELAEKAGLEDIKGVYVMGVNEGSAAQEAGLKEGDVIMAINDVPTKNTAELQEQVATHRPGDEIKVTFKRDGKMRTVGATLKNMMGKTEIVKRESEITIEGGTFTDLTKEETEKYNLEGGVKLMELENGKWARAGMKEGFIIISIDKVEVLNVMDLKKVLNKKEGGILIEGMYENGEQAYYGIGWGS